MKNNVKYLVTGAAGFLGGTICRQLMARGELLPALNALYAWAEHRMQDAHMKE